MTEQKTWRLGVAGLGTVGTRALLTFLAEHRQISRPAGGQCRRDRRLRAFAVAAQAVRHRRASLVRRSQWRWRPRRRPDVFVELIGGIRRSSQEPHRGRGGAAGREARGHREQGLDRRTWRRAGEPRRSPRRPVAVRGRGHGRRAGGQDRARGPGRRRYPLRSPASSTATCNYIPARRRPGGDRARPDSPKVLDEAQRLGYTEADPTMDVGGSFDAAARSRSWRRLAFGTPRPLLRRRRDRRIARERRPAGYPSSGPQTSGIRIKLVASADRSPDGVLVRVHPSSLRRSRTPGPGRAERSTRSSSRAPGPAGSSCWAEAPAQGRGAGYDPTAAAVAADIADVMASAVRPVFQAPAETADALHARRSLAEHPAAPICDCRSRMSPA